MRPRGKLVGLRQFQVNEQRRQLLQLDMMIADFERMVRELEYQIDAEEKKVGISDINHFAYPTFATAVRLRRDNLKNSQSDLQRQRTAAEPSLSEAEAELSKAQMMDSRSGRRNDIEPGNLTDRSGHTVLRL